MERLVEGGTVDGEYAIRPFRDPMRDRIAVHGLPRERPEDENVHRTLQDFGRRPRHRLSSHQVSGRWGRGCAAAIPARRVARGSTARGQRMLAYATKSVSDASTRVV